MKYNLDIDLSNNTSGSIILRHITPGAKVLEFGPASGYMTRYMKETLGCTIWCVEIDSEMAEITKQYCDEMIVGDIDQTLWIEKMSNQQFDYIIFADVLEHLRNPKQALATAKTLLTPQGIILTSIPNIGHNAILMELMQGKFQYMPTGILDDTHVRFFTRESIIKLLDSAGLSPVKWLGVFTEPQYTEFEQRYTEFPEDVQTFLKQRMDGHLYQFITLSKKSEELTDGERFVTVTIEGNQEENGLTNDYLQVYWENKGNFTEECSLKKPISYGNAILQYDVSLPKTVQGKLRIDPINHSACVEIESIGLYVQDPTLALEDTPVILLTAGNDFAGMIPGHDMLCMNTEKNYEFIATGSDAHFFVDTSVAGKDDSITHIRVKMRATKEATTIMKWMYKKFYDTQNVLNSTQYELVNTRHEFDTTMCNLFITQHELNALQQENMNLEHQIKVILGSNSWKATALLRDMGAVARRGKKACHILRHHGIGAVWSKIQERMSAKSHGQKTEIGYEEWVASNHCTAHDCSQIYQKITKLPKHPLFSIIVPVYNVEEIWLRKCIDSVLAQLYPYWELCIADDASTMPHVKRVLEEYAAKDARIKVVFRRENGHISLASNSALAIATGEYIALLDNDDELAPEALFENALLINEKQEADFIYSDEDKLNMDNMRTEPFFKPDWSPELFRSQMYVGHLCVMRRNLVTKVGGFRQGFEGSQDYDLVLRIVEKTTNIFHIPKVLYHWRKLPTSTAGGFAAKPYAHDAGLLALTEHAQRIWGREKCQVSSAEQYFQYSFFFPIPNQPLVSIIIPTKDHHELLETCLQSILTKSTYSNFEIIILNNNSKEPETFAYLDKIAKDQSYKTRVIDAPIPFNWSKLNNIGIREARGDFFIFLNNDIEIITENWLEWLVGYANRPDIGVVGPMLLYPDNSIQHAGVVMGVGGYADHVYKGQNPDTAQACFVSPNLIRNVAAVTGACLVVAREKIERYGMFDEKFIICGSDVEICLRLMKADLYNVYVPQVKLYHHESKSRDSYIPENDFIMSKKAYRDYLKHGDPYYNPNLSLEGTHAKFCCNK